MKKQLIPGFFPKDSDSNVGNGADYGYGHYHHGGGSGYGLQRLRGYRDGRYDALFSYGLLLAAVT